MAGRSTELRSTEEALEALSARLRSAVGQEHSGDKSNSSSSSSFLLSEAASREVVAVAAEFDAKVVPAIARLVQRAAKLDPETNTPTYGERARKRVQALTKHSEGLGAELELWRDTALSKTNEEERRASLAAKEAADAARQDALKIFAASVKKAPLDVLTAPTPDRAKLDEAARKVQALAEAEEAKDPAKRAAAQVRREMCLVRKPLPTNLAGALALVDTCPDAEARSRALAMLEAIITNVVAHPDEERFRTVRCENEHFVTGLGAVVPGGRECLLALGFEAQVKETMAVFFMEEPDPSVDVDAWSTWFASLEESQKLIKATTQQGS